MMVDLWFPVRGGSVPAHHAYLLYSAVCSLAPGLHGERWWGLHTLRGRIFEPGRLHLSRRARVGLRLPPEQIPQALTLSGKQLVLGGDTIQLGVPAVTALAPSRHLKARLVTVRGYEDSQHLEARLREELSELGIEGALSVGRRRVVRVRGRNIVGFAVGISGLSDEPSVALQRRGLGGRRRFGCGLFLPGDKPLERERGGGGGDR